MKSVRLESANLQSCITAAPHDRVVVTRQGKPVALIVGVEGMAAEQLQLGSSHKFWKLIESRRGQKPITRGTLEKKLGRKDPASRSERLTRASTRPPQKRGGG
jgi:antitoxin (DNA-binding transcriptional repressor) of toxin-antitoxin stability system